MYVFVTMCCDYADEFDVMGCFVEEKAKFEQDLAAIRENFNGEPIYFGTNEALEFDDFEHFEGTLDVKECSKQFYDEFIALNGGSSHGHNYMEDLLP